MDILVLFKAHYLNHGGDKTIIKEFLEEMLKISTRKKHLLFGHGMLEIFTRIIHPFGLLQILILLH